MPATLAVEIMLPPCRRMSGVGVFHAKEDAAHEHFESEVPLVGRGIGNCAQRTADARVVENTIEPAE
jgi:hypothetical protein